MEFGASQDQHDREEVSADERSQIAERLRWSPSERLAYLVDMLAFEQVARRAVRLER